MDTQMDHPRSHTTAYGEDPQLPHDHNVGLQHTGGGHDEGEHHGEKKSVLKKVKAKAKKIKDTIKGHVGHGHDDDDDDDDNEEMDTDTDVHGAHAAHGTTKEGITRQHGTNTGERIAIGSHASGSNPGAYQVFDTMTTHYVPGQETLGWSRTDTGTLPQSENQHHALRHAPGIAHSSGTRSTGDLGVGHKPKLGGILEKDSHVLKNVGEDVRPANYQAKFGDPTGAAHGITLGKEGITRQHGTDIGERTAIGGHAPVNDPGAYQVFDTTTTHYVPGQEETLGWSRTNTGTLPGSVNQPHALRQTPDIAYSSGNRSTGELGVGHRPKLGGIVEKDSHVLKNVGGDVHPAKHQARVSDTTGRGYDSAAGQNFGLGQGGIAREHGDNLGGAPMEGASHIPLSKPAEYQTFDTPTSRYIPGQEETMGWSITDTGRSNLSKEQPYAPKTTPMMAHPGHYRTEEMREAGKIGELLDKPTILEKDPHAPRDFGERCHAENYQSKVIDPTGRGGEEIGVTPILNQLGKMNIHDESSQKTDSTTTTRQQSDLFRPSLGQHEKISTGSHDLSPEPVTKPQFDPTTPSGPGLHEEQKPESYTEKISSAASELACKAKLATGSITSKLGYGGSHETPSNEQPRQSLVDQKPGGYGETHEEMFYQGEDQSKAGSIGDYGKKVVSTVQEKIAPVYDKVAGLGSTVASKVQGSGPQHNVGSTGLGSTVASSGPQDDMGSTVPPDKGVSVKEYLVGKLKPGEEDKALSKAITEALPLHKSKDNPIDFAEGDEETMVTKVVIKGRVTESEEVANRLGRSEDKSYDDAGPGLASPGKSVMDRIRDAAGSWFNNSSVPGIESDDHTVEEGNERTQRSSVRDTQKNQNAGYPGVQ